LRGKRSFSRFGGASGRWGAECAADYSLVTIMKPWTVRERTPIGDFRVFRLWRESSVSQDTGREHDFFVLGAADWVNVVPVTDAGEVVLVAQYRAGSKEVALEIPGGIVDPGETPAQAAARELREETGYAAREIVPLGSCFTNPAILDNRLHTFLATGATRVGDARPDGSEELEVVVVEESELEEMVRGGRVNHALVLVALYHLARRRARGGLG
jgi:8-oxo-dGTP pyrophosphatase MutT (NUDIX family)